MKTVILFTIFMFVLDQFTKFLVDNFIAYNSYVNVVTWFNFLNITNIHNTGIAFSMFENKNLILSCVVFLVLIIIIVFLYKNVSKLSKIKKYAFYLILSGGFGNLSDRLLRGAVVDFIDFGINSLRWPSFNIADSCIFVATILFFIDIIFIDCKKNNN